MNLLEKNVGLCEICDNFTPRLWVEEFNQECCELCFNAYGECNQHLLLSAVSTKIRITKKGKKMKITKLNELQRQYDSMVSLAEFSNYNLTPEFAKELIELTKMVKSLGGKI